MAKPVIDDINYTKALNVLKMLKSSGKLTQEQVQNIAKRFAEICKPMTPNF